METTITEALEALRMYVAAMRVEQEPLRSQRINEADEAALRVLGVNKTLKEQLEIALDELSKEREEKENAQKALKALIENIAFDKKTIEEAKQHLKGVK
jgi:phosphopantothenate synthetase